jgi:capsular polysaccharide biosynthesis protein
MRLYIRRSDEKTQRVSNQYDLIKMLGDFGFKEIVAENYSIREQVEIFSQAEIIVAPIGAGLANMMFLPTGATVLEIVGSKRRNPHFKNLASALNLKYGYITNQGLPDEKDRDEWDKNFNAPLNRVKQALIELGL